MTGFILSLPKNTEGEDYIIGDLHGSLAELQALLNRLHPADRLFIVGDLADRGPSSQEIFVTIIAWNASRKKANLAHQIWVVKGNHDDLLAKYYNLRQATINLFPEEFREEYAFHCKSSEKLSIRRSLIKDEIYEKEASQAQLDAIEECTQKINGHITGLGELILKADEKGLSMSKLNAFSSAERDLADKISAENMGGEWIVTLYAHAPHKLKAYAEYVENLPSILLVENDDPFILVHASCPYPYAQLKERLTSNPILSDKEDDYVMYARANRYWSIPIMESDAKATDSLVYCGHTIYGGPRLNSNHINVDIGTYAYHDMCLIAHKAQFCKIVNVVNLQSVESLHLLPGRVAPDDNAAADQKSEININFVNNANAKKLEKSINAFFETRHAELIALKSSVNTASTSLSSLETIIENVQTTLYNPGLFTPVIANTEGAGSASPNISKENSNISVAPIASMLNQEDDSSEQSANKRLRTKK